MLVRSFSFRTFYVFPLAPQGRYTIHRQPLSHFKDLDVMGLFLPCLSVCHTVLTVYLLVVSG